MVRFLISAEFFGVVLIILILVSMVRRLFEARCLLEEIQYAIYPDVGFTSWIFSKHRLTATYLLI